MYKINGSVLMIITVKSMRKPTRKMASVADAGTTVASRRASLKTANLMVSWERSLKMALYLKACGSMDGDTVKDLKKQLMDSNVLEHGTITIISNNKQCNHHYEHI
jgi:hypothetical protein